MFQLTERLSGAAASPVVLVIMDGVGVGAGDAFDAVTLARTPTLDSLRDQALTRTLRAHGVAVGLPSDSDMGNSEVGHNILGAGRIFDQGAKCVNRAITNGSIFGSTWSRMLEHVGQSDGRALHLLGLLSDGNVHASIHHLEALIERAAHDGIRRVFLHVLLDGRDVPDRTATEYLQHIEATLARTSEANGGEFRVASGGGRMVTTMDRYEADWRIVERGWRAHVLGDAAMYDSACAAVEAARAAEPGISDQGLPPFVIGDNGQAVGAIRDGDAVIVYNFRGDRAQQICRAFIDDDFDAFDRVRRPSVFFASMIQYDGDLNLPPHYLVSPETVQGTVSEYLANSGITQFACAETQKYGHVTYFWNGNRSGKFSAPLETYLEVASDAVPFEQRPWMKSAETADAIVEAIESGQYRFIRTNLAGGDMVGHTGDIQAAIIAIEAVDLALGRIMIACRAVGATLVVTADHGNADDMVERDATGTAQTSEDGQPRWRTSHSLNPVPLYILAPEGSRLSLRHGLNQAGLANVAATLVELLGFEAPQDFEPSLVDLTAK
ncbi:MAG: 2,3-bisphosphoglycerate-independent phosphoglycerate mutase [Chromatiales bacterium]|jgi:2,3-bisphosphoglycerate-independent phosphoglycerate mutase|nr:2,3-bisphosphoglycerate-independent phosphoglycerate mutase [Chromatiales bacterium]